MDRRIALRAFAAASAAGLLARTAAAQTSAVVTQVAGDPVPMTIPGYTDRTLAAGTLSKETSQLALERAQNPRVKEFAGFEVAEQTAIAQVLTEKQMPPPAPLDQVHASELQALHAQTSGPMFDRAYVAAQLKGHQELLSIQQAYLDTPTRVRDAQHVAILARAVIMQHLTMLQDLQNTLQAA